MDRSQVGNTGNFIFCLHYINKLLVFWPVMIYDKTDVWPLKFCNLWICKYSFKFIQYLISTQIFSYVTVTFICHPIKSLALFLIPIVLLLSIQTSNFIFGTGKKSMNFIIQDYLQLSKTVGVLTGIKMQFLPSIQYCVAYTVGNNIWKSYIYVWCDQAKWVGTRKY